MLRLAEFITKHGQRAEARTWYVRGAELGDSRAAAALAFLVEEDGEPTEAARWRKQAAELARANLTLNKATLRAAYGETAVLCHTAIMTAHADALAQQGKNGEAEFWYRCAAEHGDSAAAHRLDQLLREPGT
jgi:TPR repeat protein